jgi:hypothetical protein
MHLHIDFAGIDTLEGNSVNVRDGHPALGIGREPSGTNGKR